ncbi:MAG: hypothetical protein ACXVFO_00670 [Solirubrobacteraceae bacterium]
MAAAPLTLAVPATEDRHGAPAAPDHPRRARFLQTVAQAQQVHLADNARRHRRRRRAPTRAR